MDEPKRKSNAVALLKIRSILGSNATRSIELEEYLKRLRGVLNAKINFVTDTVEISYDPDQITIEKIKGSLKKPGKAKKISVSAIKSFRKKIARQNSRKH